MLKTVQNTMRGVPEVAETFVNFKQTVITANFYLRLKTRRVSWARNISYFVHNKSFTNSAVVRFLVSPDRKVWTVDGIDIVVGPRQLAVLVPNYFSKYCSLEYKSDTADNPAVLDTWFQMTRPPARSCFGVGNDWS